MKNSLIIVLSFLCLSCSTDNTPSNRQQVVQGLINPPTWIQGSYHSQNEETYVLTNNDIINNGVSTNKYFTDFEMSTIENSTDEAYNLGANKGVLFTEQYTFKKINDSVLEYKRNGAFFRYIVRD